MFRQLEAAAVRVYACRILDRCSELAQLTDEPGCITRSFLSPAMDKANTLVASWMQQAGLSTELDAAGNLIGTLSCGRQDAPLLVLGSHLDTVRDAGAYDGILGVLLALAVVENLEETQLPFDLEVIGFSDEEGLRYGVPFLGSRGLIGELDTNFLEKRDKDGVTMATAIEQWGGDPQQIQCRYRNRRLIGYFEAHIEQGPTLEHRDLPLGILEAISGSCWLNLTLEGRAGHAGTTPMDLRRDPMPAAAEIVLATEDLARQEDGLVATVGKLCPIPGAGNVIAGKVELSLDMRHPNSRRLDAAVECCLDHCREVAQKRGLHFDYEVLHRQDGVEANAELSNHLAEAVTMTGTEAFRLPIGAGHDALIMARIMPIAMLLLRSPGGISHHPDENVLPQDVEAAVAAMDCFVRRLASQEASADDSDPVKMTLPRAAGLPDEIFTGDVDS